MHITEWDTAKDFAKVLRLNSDYVVDSYDGWPCSSPYSDQPGKDFKIKEDFEMLEKLRVEGLLVMGGDGERDWGSSSSPHNHPPPEEDEYDEGEYEEGDFDDHQIEEYGEEEVYSNPSVLPSQSHNLQPSIPYLEFIIHETPSTMRNIFLGMQHIPKLTVGLWSGREASFMGEEVEYRQARNLSLDSFHLDRVEAFKDQDVFICAVAKNRSCDGPFNLASEVLEHITRLRKWNEIQKWPLLLDQNEEYIYCSWSKGSCCVSPYLGFPRRDCETDEERRLLTNLTENGLLVLGGQGLDSGPDRRGGCLTNTKATIIDIVEPYHRRGIPSNYDSSLQIVDKHSAQWQLLMTAVPMSEAIMRDMYQKPSDVTTAIIEQFDESDYFRYKARIKPPIDGTCVWFLGVPEFVQWLESQSSSLLWISGDPGCGKTTLATFLLDSIDRLQSQDLSLYGTDYLTTYFFFDWSTEDQVDGTALLFALIHQLLQADPALAPIAEKHVHRLNLENLCDIFEAIVSAPERKHQRIVCVLDALDALDECEAVSMTKAITFLASLIPRVGWLKLAVTSHRNQHLDKVFSNLPAHHQIHLTDHAEHIRQDIEKFIRARCVQVLEIMDCHDDMRRDIEEELIKRSDNTFLWVNMVLEQLKNNPHAWLEFFVPTLRSTDKLDGLYNSTFERSKAPGALLRTLSIIAASQRPLTLDEIDDALAVQPDDRSIRQVLERSCVDITEYLDDVCGPFIRIRDGEVSFRHKTATEFLLRSADVPRPPVGNGMYQYKGCLDVVGVNKCLAEICAVYLTLDGAVSDSSSSGRRAGIHVTDFDDEGFDNEDYPTVEENSGPTCRKSGRGAGLFDYAAKYWGTHYRLGYASSSASTGSRGNHTIFDKAIALCNTSTCTFHDWFQLYWNTISTIPEYPDNLAPLMIASHMGLLDLVRELLADGKGQNKQSNHLQVADSEGWTALHWAVWNGHGIKNDETIALLLQHHHDRSKDSIYNKPHDNDCHCNESTEDQQSFPAGSSTYVLDIKDNKGLTPLHWAAADDQTGVVQLLLKAGATVDVFDGQGMTALTVAYENGFIGTFEALLEYGADVNVPYPGP
ncbi:hypothetical protein FOXB_01965 [Fusarium oxysporum f. sp. conglutinans Fo5176]|uniref:Uncharacterized protein n=2 Tax=Fusarium oxysporum f. sp. conglutinans TaxID=100902 RepID=F9F6E0_FUSOF|nr:hypothetical protein FOXB_01965 [Fusarium oxysporum f. sp. conglutinans Fo5176]